MSNWTIIEEDIYERKKDKAEIKNDISKEILPILKKINYKSSWINFANLLVKQVKKDILEEVYNKTIENSKKYKIKYYQFVYKLTNAPIMYPISIKETKLFWPWDLTPYQKFKLSNPNYRNNPIYKINLANNINTNYVIIE